MGYAIMNELVILVAEDRPADVLLLKHAFRKAGVGVSLHFVSDGQEAVDYLNGDERFGNRAEYPLPTLLLLDLNMPRLNGFDVLDWVRHRPGLRRLVVVVFTTSDLPEDIARAYELGVNSYMIKPPELANLEEIAHHLEHYWFKLNRCPDCVPG